MNPVSDEILSAYLINDGKTIQTSESKIIEFKSIWDWDNKELLSKIAKTIAGMCNADGGYIFFGIDDKTKEISGVSDFDRIDASTLTSYLNNYFSPSVKTQKRSIQVAGKTIGVIYTEKYQDIPSICIKSYDKTLSDGIIYYRYSSMTEAIKGVELIHLLHQLKGANNNSLLEFQKEERKRVLRPELHVYDYTRMGDDCDFCIGNTGSKAFIKGFNSLSSNYNFLFYHLDKLLEKTIKLPVYGRSKFRNSGNGPTGSFELLFTDEINTQYRQVFTITNGVWDRSRPIEIPD